MLKFVQKKLKEEKGLTLIELLAVIVILGIIAAIAIPAIGNIIENSRVNALKADGINVLNAANLYFAENADEPTATQDNLAPYLENEGGMQDGYTVTRATGGNTLDGSATHTSGVSVTFNNSTVENINAAPTSQGTHGTVVIDRGDES